jgi:hypothetical protein
MRSRALAACVTVWLCCAGGAPSGSLAAESSAVDDAQQLAGLFVQSCVQFAGDVRGLRDWARKTGFPPLPAPGQAAFLNGLPGVAYDATNTRGKFVLISEDVGECSVVAERADPAAVVTSLEGFLHDQKVAFQLTAQHADSQEAALQHREYSASRDGRNLGMLVSTTSAEGGGEAMLSVTSP